MNKENYTWLKTLSIGFMIASLGIIIAILGAVFLNNN